RRGPRRLTRAPGRHDVPTAARCDTGDLGVGDAPGAVLLGDSEVRHIEGVLRTVIAADHALPHERAAPARYAVDVRSPSLGVTEGDGQIRADRRLRPVAVAHELLDELRPFGGRAGARVRDGGSDLHHVRGQ